MTLNSPLLSLEGVSKRYGASTAVHDVSFDVAEGEFVSLLGPSGSGKTTTLQMIAGFIDSDSGAIRMRGRELGGVPTHRRDIGVVFQNYALFPHLTVAQNIAFPLRMRRVGSPEIKRRVAEAIDRVQLGPFAGRKPAALSGGQQQRVALARAFVFEPKLLLMDEPLGALDKKLRELLQTEIQRIVRELGVTVVYVTHDQDEALAMSDRIAIYNDGRIEQLGSGPDLYRRPESLFVATFMGDSNVLTGALTHDGRLNGIDTPLGVLTGVSSAEERLPPVGDRAKLVVRPEQIRIADVRAGELPVKGRVVSTTYLGSHRRTIVNNGELGDLHVLAPASSAEGLLAGDEVTVSWAAADAIVLADTPPATLTGLIATA
jgi:putative spermidine/putrescine transport system ATP-binding protein